MRLFSVLAAAAVTLFLATVATPATAQVPAVSQPQTQGTAYFVFAEPGAPTFEVVVLGSGARNGLYKFQEGTTLVEALALMGGLTSRSDSTTAGVTTALVRVYRETAGTYNVIYEAEPDEVLQTRANHPTLQTGDTIETIVNFVPAPEEGFTFRDGLDIFSRLSSVVSLIFLISRNL